MSAVMTRVWLTVIGLLVAALGVEGVRGDRARASAMASALVRDSVEAARDSSREVTAAAERTVLRDSVRVFVRRAQQQEQRADALDRALKMRRVARMNAAVRVATLDTVVRVDTVVVSADSEHRAAFTVRQAPYSVTGEVHIAASNADSVSLQIELDSIPLEVRLACGPTPGFPVQSASVVAVAPRWAHVSIGNVSQSPAVCNPEATRAGRSEFARMLGRIGLSAGAAVGIDRNGQVAMQPALLIGIHLWPW